MKKYLYIFGIILTIIAALVPVGIAAAKVLTLYIFTGLKGDSLLLVVPYIALLGILPVVLATFIIKRLASGYSKSSDEEIIKEKNMTPTQAKDETQKLKYIALALFVLLAIVVIIAGFMVM